MAELVLSENSGSEDLAPLALAMNQILGLPITIKCAGAPGVRVEDGKVLDDRYSGPVLEEVLKSGQPVRTVPKRGAYQGVPVSVAPLMGREGEIIAAIGVVDVMGTVDIPAVFGAYSEVLKQVSEER